MTPQEFAARLNGREYGIEMTSSDGLDAKAAGLVVVFGASDDLCEFEGAISDEIGAYGGKTILLHDGSIVTDDECECAAAERERVRIKREGRRIKAIWCDEAGGPSWTYETDIPHATFNVMEDGEVYCCGIVFRLADACNRAPDQQPGVTEFRFAVAFADEEIAAAVTPAELIAAKTRDVAAQFEGAVRKHYGIAS